jgi:putative toxin-antitoxin system antitoxin component (TIGR02293 family)
MPESRYNDPVIDAGRVADILGVKARTVRDLALAVEKGLQALSRTVVRVIPERGAARRLLVQVVPDATFKRRIRLSPRESERTERLARVIAAAEYVWDDRKDARAWLNTPHPELENRAPIQAAMSELGARRVEDLLDCILYGLPA